MWAQYGIEMGGCGNDWKKTSGFLLYSRDWLKRQRCKKVGWTEKVMCSG